MVDCFHAKCQCFAQVWRNLLAYYRNARSPGTIALNITQRSATTLGLSTPDSELGFEAR